MPYLNGKRVSNDEYIEAKSGSSVDWKDAFGHNDGEAVSEPEAEEPKRRPRRGGKKAEAQSALEQITGLDIDLGDDTESQENE
jgi:hypothetical protein